MFSLPWRFKVIRHFPYRTAWPDKTLCEWSALHLDGGNEDAHQNFRRIQRELAAKLPGNGLDNHTGYEIETEDGTRYFVWFSNWTIAVSLAYREDK